MLRTTSIFALALAPALAFADPLLSTMTADNALTEAPTEWLGEEPHLVIMGTVSSYDFDMQVSDFDKLDIHELSMKREYLLNETDYSPYQELDFGIEFMLDGMAKQIEGKLVHADFNKLGDLPNTFSLQSEEEFPEGDMAFTEFEFEWEADGRSVNEEIADWTGTATVNLDPARGQAPNGDGLIGGYINAVNGDNNIVISYTLNVTEFEVED
ncbi:hypothetical protein [Yoonia maritima]|uniref:hypothetical protein n=1 Tax=Yoonia maritima TaxID=1435347 RepID=UPI0013A62CCD|nr:hypothetical protein [Yoonia maritima]